MTSHRTSTVTVLAAALLAGSLLVAAPATAAPATATAAVSGSTTEAAQQVEADWVTGTMHWWNQEKGFGFITYGNGLEAYFNFRDVPGGPFGPFAHRLEVGMQVIFHIVQYSGGRIRAIDIHR